MRCGLCTQWNTMRQGKRAIRMNLVNIMVNEGRLHNECPMRPKFKREPHEPMVLE